MSRPTVKKYVDMLCGKGLIDVEPTEVYWNGGRKYNGNLEYTILPIQEAVNSYNERQMRIIEKNQKEALLKQRMLEYERLKAISATDLQAGIRKVFAKATFRLTSGGGATCFKEFDDFGWFATLKHPILCKSEKIGLKLRKSRTIQVFAKQKIRKNGDD